MTVRSGAAGTAIAGGWRLDPVTGLLRGLARLGGLGSLSASSPLPPRFAEARFGAHATTFDPAFKWAQAALSDDNLTVTAVPTATTGTSTRSVLSFSSGKYYCEFHAVVNDNNSGVGICNSSQTTSQSLGATLNALGYFANGTVRINSGTASTIDTYAAGNTVGMAVSFDTERIWFRINDGDWNASGSADPETNVGGIDFSSLNAGPYYAAVECRSNGTNDSLTADFIGDWYQGPGDVVPGAVFWGGLRAYTKSGIGSNAIRLRESGGSTEQDFATIAGGGLDLSAISTFKGANNLFVVTLYDQTGNGLNYTQATAANQPVFTLSGWGELPIITFDHANQRHLEAASGPSATQPLTTSLVLRCTDSTGDRRPMTLNTGIFTIAYGFGSSANSALFYAGSVDTNVSGLNDNTYYALNAVWDNTSSIIYVDATGNARSVGTNNPSGATTIGSAVGGQFWTGQILEYGVWDIAFSPTEASAMSTNQHEYFGPYTGPGDIVGGAVAWWGLRAYSLASVGANAVRLREDGGNTEQDFVTIAGGGLDLAAIATFKGANDLFVVTLYDQAGTNDLTQAVAGSQPTFLLNGIGSLPIIDTTAASAVLLSGSFSQAQPFTISSVYNKATTADMMLANATAAGLVQLRPGTFGANTLAIYAGSFVSAVATDNAWHAVQAVYNGASSDANVDGVVDTGDANTQGFSAENIAILGKDIGVPFVGFSVEYGLWGSAFSGGNSSALSANQHAYWGF